MHVAIGDGLVSTFGETALARRTDGVTSVRQRRGLRNPRPRRYSNHQKMTRADRAKRSAYQRGASASPALYTEA
jgi:hypothetical protein